MVINEDYLLSIEVVRDIVNSSRYTAMNFLDMHIDFVNALVLGIEKTTKALQE